MKDESFRAFTVAAKNRLIRHKLPEAKHDKGFPGVGVLAKDEKLWGERRVRPVRPSTRLWGEKRVAPGIPPGMWCERRPQALALKQGF